MRTNAPVPAASRNVKNAFFTVDSLWEHRFDVTGTQKEAREIIGNHQMVGTARDLRIA